MASSLAVADYRQMCGLIPSGSGRVQGMVRLSPLSSLRLQPAVSTAGRTQLQHGLCCARPPPEAAWGQHIFTLVGRHNLFKASAKHH